MNEQLFYRYEAQHFVDGGVNVVLFSFAQDKRTNRGVWIIDEWNRHQRDTGGEFVRHWVADNTKKRFAHPTMDAAWEAYQARKSAEIRHLRNRLRRAELALQANRPKEIAHE